MGRLRRNVSAEVPNEACYHCPLLVHFLAFVPVALVRTKFRASLATQKHAANCRFDARVACGTFIAPSRTADGQVRQRQRVPAARTSLRPAGLDADGGWAADALHSYAPVVSTVNTISDAGCFDKFFGRKKQKMLMYAYCTATPARNER